MQAIQTKYFGPTDFRGTRIKVSSQAATIWVPWDHALDVYSNHRAAAEVLAKQLEWTNGLVEMKSGQLPDGSYAHVFCW